LSGLAHPDIFSLLHNPTAVPKNGFGSFVAQFSPPSSDGTWTDQGTLTLSVADTDVFCEPLPMPWNAMTNTAPITMSGSSDSSFPITADGSFAFPATDCGSGGLPTPQQVTLTNHTNVAYPYSAKFDSGTFYVIQDAGPGVLAPNGGQATIVVAPKTVTPGPGVQAGSAAYADALTVTVGGPMFDAGASPVWTKRLAISWALNGAVLSFPPGPPPQTDAMGSFYPVDSSGLLTLPMINSGTADATVNLTVSVPSAGAFTFSPGSQINLVHGGGAAPTLTAAAGDSACPATTNGTVSFSYSGPVCQPLPTGSVNVRVCAGTFQ
jgi:hypothetical protein